MKETCFTNINEDALMACRKAFGCLIEKVAEKVIVYSFCEGDAGVIIDTMTETGATLIYNKTPDELLEEG